MSPADYTVPADPTHVTRAITPQLTTFCMPFLRFGKIKFGGRSTLIRLATGSLAIFSPTPFTPDVANAIANAIAANGGSLRYIIAPDIEHHLQLAAYKAAFPTAVVIGPQALYDKRKAAGQEDVKFDFGYTAENKLSLQLPKELSDEVEVEFWDGHVNKELVFLHKPSRTLIEADLVFNLPATEQYSKTGEDAASGGIVNRLGQYFANKNYGHKGQQQFNW